MEYEPANIIKPVPEDAIKWTAEEAQAWARKVLAGGPPDKPTDIQTQEEIDWADIKKFVGKKVRITARPKGLIFKFDDGTRKYVPGDAATSNKSQGSALKNISTAAMQKKSKVELKIRIFAKDEIKRYNKKIGDDARIRKGTATLEFWESGKRIHNFLKENEDISREQITQALEQWGRGEYGYGKRTFEYALYFFDWMKNLQTEDKIFTLSETRIMNIILATKNPAERAHLVLACLEGPFKNLSDSQFKWVTGQSRGNFPENKTDLFDKVNNFGIKVMKGGTLLKEESDDLSIIFKSLQKRSQ